MKKTKHDWAGHVAAMKTQKLSTIDYAQRHGLARSTLYRWRNKLQRASTQTPQPETQAAPESTRKFIALRWSEPEPPAAPAPTHCTLVLTGGIRLEMPVLPSPQWLADLGRCAQGAR